MEAGSSVPLAETAVTGNIVKATGECFRFGVGVECGSAWGGGIALVGVTSASSSSAEVASPPSIGVISSSFSYSLYQASSSSPSLGVGVGLGFI